MAMRLVSMRVAAAAALVVGLTACERGDPRLEGLRAGMAKDSALVVMGGSPQRVDAFLTNGQYVEAMYFPRPGRAAGDSASDRDMSPVVAINGQVAGWGWTWWDSAAAAQRITVAPPAR